MWQRSIALVALVLFATRILAQSPTDGLQSPVPSPPKMGPSQFYWPLLQAQSTQNHGDPNPGTVRDIGDKSPFLPPTFEREGLREVRSIGPASVFRGGMGFYYIRPYFDTNPAFAQATNLVTPIAATTVTSQTNFDWGYRLAPLVWLEYVHRDMLGFRVRWWEFDCAPPSLGAFNAFNPGGPTTLVTSAFPLGMGVISNPAAAAAGFNDTLQFQSSLRVNVFDFEFTKEFRGMSAWISVAAGARYAEVEQSYDASLQSIPAVPLASTVVNTLLSSHEFQGAGGTIAFDAGYTFCDTGLSVFCTARGSLLYGLGRERATLHTVMTNAVGLVTTQSLEASTQQDRLLPVGEIEIGAEYARCVGRVRFIARTALANQVWFGAGNAANNETITGTGTLLAVPVTQAADNSINLGFFGLTATFGVQY